MKFRSIISLIALSIFTLPLLSQPLIKQWDARFGSTGDDGLASFLQTTDGGYFFAGSSTGDAGGDKSHDNHHGSWGNNHPDYWVVKTDQAGVKLWENNYGGFHEDHLMGAVPGTDGGYLLSGWAYCNVGGDHTQGRAGGPDYWVIKIDDNGTTEWDRRYGGSHKDYGTCVTRCNGGGYVLGGYSRSGLSGDKSQYHYGSNDYWAVKIDQHGVKQWDVDFGGTYSDAMYAVIQTSDGGYLFGGSSSSGISGNKTQDSRGLSDMWVIKTDGNGVKQWDYRYGGAGDDGISAMAQLADGYLLGGTSISGLGGDKTQPTKGGNDFWLVRIDANGNKLWDKDLGGSGNETLKSITKINDGGFLICGSSTSSMNGDVSDHNHASNDYWIVKIDSAGNKLWDKLFGGTGSETIAGAIKLSEGKYIFAGSSSSGISGDRSQPNWGAGDYWMINAVENPSGFITTYPVSQAYFFHGDSFDVSYGLLGTFNAGNVFTVQLSDATGSFSSSTTIGSLTSTSTGTIIAVIPDAVAFGNAYRVRVVSSDPVVIGNDNGSNLFISNIKPPEKAWDARLGGTEEDQLFAAEQTADHGFILGGHSLSGFSGDKTQSSEGLKDYWVVKTDSNGIQQWNSGYGGSDNDYMTCLLQTADDGYLYGGYSYSGISGDKSEPSQGSADYWVLKTDANGLKQWDKRYGGSESEIMVAIEPTTDGGFILGGGSYSPADGDKSQGTQGQEDFWIVKIDANGVKQWDKRFGGNSTDRLISLEQTSDGGYILGGYSVSPASGDKSQGNFGDYDYWVVKADASGIKQWDKRFGGSGGDFLSSIKETGNGDFIMGGRSNSVVSGNKSTGHIGSESYTNDYWLVRINSTGDKLWDKTLGGAGDDFLTQIQLQDDGGYQIAGYSWATPGFDQTEATQGGPDYWMLRTDSLANKMYDVAFGSGSNDYLTALSINYDGTFLLAGYSYGNTSGDKSQDSWGLNSPDYWILKTGHEPMDAATDTSSCLVPTNYSTTAITATSATTNWDATVDAILYQVQFKPTSETTWTLLSTPTNSKTLTGLTPNTQYDWQVRTLCSISPLISSDWSTTQNFTTALRLGKEESSFFFSVYPNPFSDRTVISFGLARSSDVTIGLFDIAGRKVQNILKEHAEEGLHEIYLDRNQLPAGTYLLKMRTSSFVCTQNIIIQ